jgi:hypothetical protein
LINKLEINDPNISSTDIQNVLIASYCRVVARAPLTTAEKWSRMRQFDAVVGQQVAANTLAPGAGLASSVPAADSNRGTKALAVGTICWYAGAAKRLF